MWNNLSLLICIYKDLKIDRAVIGTITLDVDRLENERCTVETSDTQKCHSKHRPGGGGAQPLHISRKTTTNFSFFIFCLQLKFFWDV
jgi:hypothetical protein